MSKSFPRERKSHFKVLSIFPFSLETSKIIIDSGVFLLYPFFHLFLYIVIVSHRCHHCCVWCLFCPTFFISNWKTMDFLGRCFHFHSVKMYVGSFSKYTLSTGTASCELLMWNGKVYADGLQFKWFASFSCPQNFWFTSIQTCSWRSSSLFRCFSIFEQTLKKN